MAVANVASTSLEDGNNTDAHTNSTPKTDTIVRCVQTSTAYLCFAVAVFTAMQPGTCKRVSVVTQDSLALNVAALLVDIYNNLASSRTSS
eukprot:m.269816 g.269816  ORF g.269816 m.269816 type:complete len:90 (+) comp86414_c0_seq1:960-1229(+)